MPASILFLLLLSCNLFKLRPSESGEPGSIFVADSAYKIIEGIRESLISTNYNVYMSVLDSSQFYFHPPQGLVSQNHALYSNWDYSVESSVMASLILSLAKSVSLPVNVRVLNINKQDTLEAGKVDISFTYKIIFAFQSGDVDTVGGDGLLTVTQDSSTGLWHTVDWYDYKKDERTLSELKATFRQIK